MLKVGIIGCNRAHKIIEVLAKTSLPMKITSVHDTDEVAIDSFQDLYPEVQCCNSTQPFFENSLIDAVYIASPPDAHAVQIKKALLSSKHVLCEVPAFSNLKDAYEVTKLVNTSKNMFMLAENYCYTPLSVAVGQLCEENFFGDISFIRSSYIHDCKNLAFRNNTPELTWRGSARTALSGNDYPTHSIGPVCKWLGVGKGLQKLKSITSFASTSLASQVFAAEKFPNETHFHTGFFKKPDVSISLIKAENGTLIELVLDTSSYRPSSMTDFYLQGLNGTLISGRYDGENPILYKREKFEKCEEKRNFKHFDPTTFLCNKDKKIRGELGRLFPLYKILENFNNSLNGKCKPVADVHDAAIWSSIIELSKTSINSASAEIPFPSDLF